MSATAVRNATALPVGTWQSDPTHSSASFAVKHMVVATFRGRFEDLAATLTELHGLRRPLDLAILHTSGIGPVGVSQYK